MSRKILTLEEIKEREIKTMSLLKERLSEEEQKLIQEWINHHIWNTMVLIEAGMYPDEVVLIEDEEEGEE